MLLLQGSLIDSPPQQQWVLWFFPAAYQEGGQLSEGQRIARYRTGPSPPAALPPPMV